jgi:hypothetical protein
MDLEVLPGRYAICRFEHGAAQPIWARSAAGPEFLSVTWTSTELSVVCPEDRVPSGIPGERGFIALRVNGTLEFDLTGVLASLTAPLAAQGIPVFAISTYQTDYLLLRAEDAARSRAVLDAAGHAVSLAAEADGVWMPPGEPEVKGEPAPHPQAPAAGRGEPAPGSEERRVVPLGRRGAA